MADGEIPAPDLGPTPYERYRRPGVRRSLASLRSWTAGLDGGLLTDASWRGRHLLLTSLAGVNAVVVIVLGARAEHGWELFVGTAALAAALVVACISGLGRRPRELAIVAAFLLCAGIQSRYVANLSPLSGAYVVLLAVYQDWLPIAACLAGILVLPLLAIVDPDELEHWRAFQREDPATGSLVRALGVYLAAGVAILIWRTNGVAVRDPLTGLATREHAKRRLGQTLHNGRRPGVFVCDVDAFQLVAGELPRAASNDLIRQVGRRLRTGISTKDRIVAAGGGASYLVVRLEDTTTDDAGSFARHLCRLVETEPFTVDGAELPLTISIGIALGEPGDEPVDLVRAGNDAMRRAKWHGSPAIAFADHQSVRPTTRPAAHLVAELKRAVEQGELVMYYQPLVDMASGEIVGAEALVRWQHPTRGLLLPGEFLPVTELHPWLNLRASEHIGRTVMSELAIWDSELPGRLPMGVSINVAATRLQDPDLRDSIERAINEAGVDPRRVTLELTEGALMDLEIDAPAVLTRLADVGLRIALDDFGTGHTSLARLRDFPLHEIKVDRSFVPGITAPGSDRAVVAAVLAIAAQFGAIVVVEGVETDSQRRALLEMQADLIGQGFYFATPMAAADLRELLAGQATLPET